MGREGAGERIADAGRVDGVDGDAVAVGSEGQHSLWPVFAEVPDGWHVAHDRDSRAACIA